MSRIFVDDIVIDEASGNAIFTVYLDVADVNLITVRYQTTHETTTSADYTPKGTTTLTFQPGETSKTVSIPISNDLIPEFKESFRLFLSAPTNATFAEDNFAFATIIDNDAQAGVPVVSINDFMVDETKKEATFFITLDKPSNSVVTMNFATQNGTALAGSDFEAQIGGSLTFNPGEMVKTVKVKLLNEDISENAEAFNLVLSNIINATAPDPVGTAIIAGNDAPRVVSNILVDDVIVDESNAFADFLVRLDAPNTDIVTVRYQEAVGTAGNGGANRDFNGLELVTLTFAPGEVVKTVRIPIFNDSVEETAESFRLFLSAESANATISDRSATATIIDNDAANGTPAASITDAYVDEANQTVTVSVILDKPSASSVSFNVTGQGITAVEGNDFQNTPFGKIAFAPGEMVKTVTFGLLNDNATENAEFFDVVLSNPVGATIADGRGHVVIAANDTARVALPVINVANVEAVENKGYVDFLVTLSAPSNNTVSVNGFTSNGTATALSNGDYVTLGGGAGALRFAPGEMVKTVRVTLTDDNIAETLENFTFNLTGAINATIGNVAATATIIDNDNGVLPAPTTINGTVRNDILKGTQQNDTMIGLDGDDVFDGGAGNDSYNGGAGNDIYLLEQTGDTYTEALNNGTDTVVSYLATHTLGANVENLILAGTAVTGIGNGLDNTITGNAAANTIDGGLGNDILNGAAGADTVSYGTATVGVTVNLALAGAQNTIGAGTDTLSNFENITGSNLNDTLTGNAAANTLIGGLGNDILNGAGGIDTLSYATASATVTVNLNVLVQQNTGSAGLDTLSNFENLIGGNFNDTLTGNGLANTINGGTGNDTLNGGIGNDILFGKAGNDILTGGLGSDTFVFDVALNALTNNDTITDYNVVDDTIRLENAIFTKFTTTGAIAADRFVSGAGAVALDANDFLLYDTNDGSLYYDADGSGAGAKVEVVSLTGIPALTAADFAIV